MKRSRLITSFFLILVISVATFTVITIDRQKQARLEKSSSDLVLQLISTLGYSWNPDVITVRMINPPLPGSPQEISMNHLYDVFARHGRLIRIDEAHGDIYVPSVLNLVETPVANYTLHARFNHRLARIEAELHHEAGQWRLANFQVFSSLMSL